jgi:methyl-accepting chemotaxis protein
VGELVADIAAASNEQSQGIGQVNTAVTEMDKVVQTNAANAEESASASEEMNAQAEQMKGMVNELIAIVNGSANGAGRMLLSAKKVSDAETYQGSKVLTPGTRGKVLAARGAEEVKPHQVIPMGDEDFKDF